MQDAKGRFISRPIEERFFERVQEPFDVQNDCWMWTGSKTGNGYGQVWLNTKEKEAAHRVAYKMFVGPIPEGFHVDHLCRNRLCVRPDHLEPLSAHLNIGQWHRARTHCRKGHPYDRENTRYRLREDRIYRQCRICDREGRRGLRTRKRGLIP